MLSEATRVREDIQRGATREELQHLLPPGGARNALDCAYWDLEAKQAGRPVWELAGLDRPRALRPTLTLGADSPAAMAQAALATDPAAPTKAQTTRAPDADTFPSAPHPAPAPPPRPRL